MCFVCVFRNFFVVPITEKFHVIGIEKPEVSSLLPSELQCALGTLFSVLPTYTCHCLTQRPQPGPAARGHPWRPLQGHLAASSGAARLVWTSCSPAVQPPPQSSSTGLQGRGLGGRGPGHYTISDPSFA